jgi:hypothetical protein
MTDHPRRFVPPWDIEDACFVVYDNSVADNQDPVGWTYWQLSI